MMRKGIKLSMKEVSNGEKEYEQGRYGESEMVICKLGGSSRHGWMGVVVFFCGEHEHLELGLGASRQEGWRDRHSVHVISGGQLAGWSVSSATSSPDMDGVRST